MVEFVISMLLGVMPMDSDVPKKIEREPMFAVVNECQNKTPKPIEIQLGKKKKSF